VLILERTQMIGILKALGAGNTSVRKIFLFNAFYLILRGLAWGNGIGIAILLIQKYFGIITLNPENYYVSEAPVYLNWGYILLLNIGIVGICLLVLMLPSYIITRISPVRAIRFECFLLAAISAVRCSPVGTVGICTRGRGLPSVAAPPAAKAGPVRSGRCRSHR